MAVVRIQMCYVTIPLNPPTLREGKAYKKGDLKIQLLTFCTSSYLLYLLLNLCKVQP